MERKTKVALTVAEVNLLRDALSYCQLSMPEGFESEDSDTLPGLLVRFEAAAHRLDAYALIDS